MKTAGLLASPYLLPAGRLFAKTLDRKVNHIVFCLFAGGIRNIESVHQNEGNLMPGVLDGEDSNIPGLDPIPPSPWPVSLASEGTLFPEMRYAQGPTGHFNGHTVALTGVYTNTGLNLRANPEYPTIFEYYLKHNTPAVTAKNAWWVSNALGPYPALNYSRHPNYGPLYGANHITPISLINAYQILSQPKQFQFHEEEAVMEIRNFLNSNFDKEAGRSDTGNFNTPQDAEEIRAFIKKLLDKGISGAFSNPLGMPDQFANNDIYTILFAEEVIKAFAPELLVVNITDVDVCHQNFSQYCNNLRKADYAVSHLWSLIQNTPSMKDDTLLIIMPEHGRNLGTNTVQDVYGRNGIDHTGDNTSREIFSLILGPTGVVNKNNQVGSASNPVGESIDMVPTMAHALGFDVNIPAGMLSGKVLSQAFV